MAQNTSNLNSSKRQSFWTLLLLTLFGIPFNVISLFPIRIWNLIRIILGVFWISKRNSYNTNKKPLPYLTRPAYYLAQLIFKLIDLTGLCEILDLIFFVVKPKSRSLTSLEIREAELVFGKTLPYWQIRVDENSWFAQRGANFNKTPSIGMGVVLFRSINFNREIICRAGNSDMQWLIHELTHVKQMQSIGSSYIFESLVAQHYWGYDFGEMTKLQNTTLSSFNVEQQAEIAKSSYKNLYEQNFPKNFYSNAINHLKSGRF